MKFGYIKDISDVVFDAPQASEASLRYLESLDSENVSPKFYIGATGWSMKEWVGTIYPSTAKTPDFLKYYGKQFNSIELNTTHYRIPDAKLIEKWKAATPNDFRFCPKVPQSISHSRDFGINKGYIQRFCENVLLLEARLGCCFMQLPPYYDASRLAQLEQFFTLFPSEVPLAVEVRHESWFSQEKAFEDLLIVCRNHGIATVTSDVAGRRDVLHTHVSTDRWIIRFVGNALHPSDYQRVDEWIDLLKVYIDNGLKEIYFFPHQHDDALVPTISAYVMEQVKKKLHIPGRGPDLERYQSGEQMSLF